MSSTRTIGVSRSLVVAIGASAAAMLAVVCGALISRPTFAAEEGWLQPGEVYREFALHNGGNRDWRVTDPNATARGAKQFLPNPILAVTIDDLEHAVRAEVMLDRWGGHLKTTAKQIRFNEHEWITIPEIQAAPPGGSAEYFYAQDNPVATVPLDQLREGLNKLEGTCGALEGYGWGQWGLYSAIVRVYYDPTQKSHAAGRIVQPPGGATVGENPTIRIEPQVERSVARVDVLAYYDGYDENGDGVFQGWHHAHFQPLRGSAAELREHVGTAWRSPYELVWNTRWVPDQLPQSIKLVARIQNGDGIWCVTPVVDQLSLVREGSSVRMYRTKDLPTSFGVRVSRMKSCSMPIDPQPPGTPLEAALALRTWHGWDGHHAPLDLNGHSTPIAGKNHHYDYDLISVPVEWLWPGDNVLTIHSETEHHMLEVLLPGPALLVRYRQ